MARRTASRTTALARAPSRTRVIVQRAAPIARRVAGAAARAALDERHTIAALVSAGVLGYLDREGQLERMSLVDGIDPKVQWALIAYLGARMTRSRTLAHVATGVGSVAIYDMVRSR
jgi:hypothetical protein